jgi:hypothetical protein
MIATTRRGAKSPACRRSAFHAKQGQDTPAMNTDVYARVTQRILAELPGGRHTANTGASVNGAGRPLTARRARLRVHAP